MKRINQSLCYELGKDLLRLTKLDDTTSPVNIYLTLTSVKASLMRVLGDDSIDLRYSRPAAEAIVEEVDRIEKTYFQLIEDGKASIKIPDKNTIPSWQLNFNMEVQRFETNLAAEFREAPTYYVPKRGAYETTDLVDKAGCILEPTLHGYMGEKAVEEFKAAGRCFAFGLPTAAGFHVCRAVEAVLEKYYEVFCGKPKKLKTWGDYIKGLEAAAKGKDEPRPKERTLHHLIELKDSSRNPIMHPRVILNDIDADILISEGKNVMLLMALEIKEQSPEVSGKPADLSGALTAAGAAGE